MMENKHTHNTDYENAPPHAQKFPKVNRIEIIGDGREYTTWDAKEVWMVLQDDERTLKIFKKLPEKKYVQADEDCWYCESREIIIIDGWYTCANCGELR